MSEFVKNWFSNMLKMDTPFVHEGIEYKTSENFYQAMKIPDSHPELRKEIAEMGPYDSKKKIRDSRYPFRKDWSDQMALSVMEKVLIHKFTLRTTWGKKLLETGTEEIVEWNNWNDLFWGKDINTKQGKNHLGKILMKIRNDLRFEAALENES